MHAAMDSMEHYHMQTSLMSSGYPHSHCCGSGRGTHCRLPSNAEKWAAKGQKTKGASFPGPPEEDSIQDD